MQHGLSKNANAYRGGSKPLVTVCGKGRCPANARLIKALHYERNKKKFFDRAASRDESVKREYRRRHNERNPHQKTKDVATRRARRKHAEPAWLSREQRNEIKQVYELAKKLNTDGLVYQVDHIVPLSGRTVCGLHVPWNLRAIPAEENQKRPRVWITLYDPPYSG
jgi:hypothetical protein